jgi:F0F1-type ATP synthase assembly protein I
MFTLENTQGYDQETLDKMNTELEKELAKYNITNEEEDSQLYKHASEKVFNWFC